MRQNSKLLAGLFLLTLGVTSCQTDYFDLERYKEIVTKAFPVQDVDTSHDWSVTNTVSAAVSVYGDYDEDYTVKIYRNNPLEDGYGVVLAKGVVKSGSVFNSKFTYPKIDSVLYVASIDSKGYRYVKPVVVENGVLETTFGDVPSAARAMTRTDNNSFVNIPTLQAPTGYCAEILAKSVELNDGNNGWNGNNYHSVNVEYEYPEWNNYQAVPISQSIVYNQDYVVNYKISTEYSGLVTHLPTAGLEATGRIIEGGNYANWTGYAAECDTVARTVYIDNGGKWTIPQYQSQTCGQGIKEGLVDGVIIVGDGGELEVDGTLNMANTARLIVLPGGKVTGTGTINVNNGTKDGEEGYNGGEISVANFNQNYGLFFNYGTITSETLIGGAGGSTFVNHGKVKVTQVQPNGGQAANLQIKNDCWFEVEKELCCKIIENGASAYIKAGTMKTSDGEGGEGLGSYIALDNSSLIHVDGEVSLNLTSIIGPTFGEFAIVEFGKVTYCNYDVDANTGKVINNLYVYVEDLPGTVKNFKEDVINQLKFPQADGNGHVTLIGVGGANLAPQEASECTPGYTPGTPTPIEEQEENEESFSFRFCYEDLFPEPGDYDFNDCVLTIDPSYDDYDSRVVYLNISIDAVGALKQSAAVLRLAGINYDHLMSVECTSGDWFDLNSDMAGQYNVNIFRAYLGVDDLGVIDPSVLTVSDAVIPLFNDCHLAINPDGFQPSGLVDRVFYNTTTPEHGGAEVPSRTVTLKLTFSDPEDVQNITSTFDPFIVEPYNSVYWEVHAYEYKTVQVFSRIYNEIKDLQLTANEIPWAIMVPGDFLYPREWVSIGYYNTEVGGAYKEPGHSFAEWAQNKTTATDWYKYPTSDDVYHPAQ